MVVGIDHAFVYEKKHIDDNTATDAKGKYTDDAYHPFKYSK
ncbi:hypothetical protein [Helicobacter suis]|nr:hypothetical protein [Helicobacter suis]